MVNDFHMLGQARNSEQRPNNTPPGTGAAGPEMDQDDILNPDDLPF